MRTGPRSFQGAHKSPGSSPRKCGPDRPSCVSGWLADAQATSSLSRRGATQVADDDLVAGGSAQLACQTIVVEPYTRVRLPRVLVDRRGLAEALRKAHRVDLPAEHTGSRGLRRRQAVLSAVIVPTSSWVVACRCPRLRVAHPPGVDDVASVTVLGLPARVKDSLLDRRAPLVGGLPRRAAHVH
jgi:hypothetical protein